MAAREASDLSPLTIRVSPVRRLVQLLGGLTLYGASMAMLVRAHLGLTPWDVLHEGLHKHLPLSFGVITAITAVIVLLAWIPLRQRPGIGTVANVIVIALAVDLTLALVPQLDGLVLRSAVMAGGIVLNGVATACYIGARLGPGPRDGLMTGLVARTGGSVRLVRTLLEVAVVVAGWLLGGTFGVGTVLYAVSIGPLAQAFLPALTIRADRAGARAAD
ncbi:YitT family protein [Amycolatopsis sp. NPDC059021]|uniref:membrane protein YczE n=1 Tax=Amycolatopsis sp. NPDC059021 TaxID=3346704 RepID=UPI0036707585